MKFNAHVRVYEGSILEQRPYAVTTPVTPQFLTKFVALELLVLGGAKLLDSIPTWAIFCASGVLLVALWVWESGLRLPSGFALSRPRIELMPLIALRDLAAKNGWRMGSLHVLDFVRALDEAGARGLLKFYARRNPDNTARELLRDRPREEVPSEEWKNLRVCTDGIMNYDCKDNADTSLRCRRPHLDRAYSDVHVERAAAKRWLRREAPQFRGQHEAETA